MERFELARIGKVESELTDPSAAPMQGDEGAPAAWLAIEQDDAEAVDGTPIVDLKPALSADPSER